MASTAPAASARSRIWSQSPPWPTSTATAMTSTPSSSPSHRTATDVSSPPLYARTTRFAIALPFLSLQPCEGCESLGHRGTAGLLGRDDEDRVVPRDRAHHVGQRGP